MKNTDRATLLAIPVSIFFLIIYFAFFAPKEMIYNSKPPNFERPIDYYLSGVKEQVNQKDEYIMILEQTEAEFLEWMAFCAHELGLNSDELTKYQILDAIYDRIETCIDWNERMRGVK